MSRPYLPAAGHDWALPFYDALVRLMGLEHTRHRLVEQAILRPGHRVLEIGCGTGTVLALIKQRHPQAEVVGLDPDPKALSRAQRKLARAALSVGLDRAFSDAMPYADGSFDRVLSSFMFHHLPAEVKRKTLSEVRRVLRPGGSFHMVDFEGSQHRGGFLVRIFHSHEALKDNAEDRVIALMRDAGLTDPARVEQGAIVFGHIRMNYYRAGAGPVASRHRAIG